MATSMATNHASAVSDVTARYGGEAFAILMPHTDGFGALMMAEQVRGAVLDRDLPHQGSPYGIVSVSIGVATVVPHGDQGAALLVARADAALGEARRQGRNRVEADEAVVAAAATAAGWFGASDNKARGPQ
jgi:two-component system chemotaxis family response regulator WspR